VASTLLWLAAFAAPSAHATEPDADHSEYRVKAAFLLQFLNYVDWPPHSFESTDAPIVLGVAGSDAVERDIAALAGERRSGARAVVIRKVRLGGSLVGLHALFISHDYGERMAAAVAATGEQPLLTVTESARGFDLGGAINFVVIENRVRFDVALRNAELHRLKISSRLLAVARQVISNAGFEDETRLAGRTAGARRQRSG